MNGNLNINGNLALFATNLSEYVSGKLVPLTSGKIQLQSEGAEIFYRNIWIEFIDKLPIKVPK